MCAVHHFELCGDFCIHSHTHVNRIYVCAALSAHHAGRSISGKEILRHDSGYFLPCLGNSFLHNAVVRAHGYQRFFADINISASRDPGDPDHQSFHFTQGMERLCDTVPPFLRVFHCFPVCRPDIFYSLFKRHDTFLSFFPVVNTKNLLNI